MTGVHEPPSCREDAALVGEGNRMTGKRGNLGTSCVGFSGFVANRRAPPHHQPLCGEAEMVKLITAEGASRAPSLGDQ